MSAMRTACLMLVGVLLGASGKAQALDIAACDAPGFEQVLQEQSAQAPVDARAYWLDRATLQWPGMHGGGHYRLYHAPDAGISASPGQPVSGAQGHLSLSADQADLPVAIAARFGFIGKGAEGGGKVKGAKAAATHCWGCEAGPKPRTLKNGFQVTLSKFLYRGL